MFSEEFIHGCGSGTGKPHAYVTCNSCIRYDKPVWMISICNLASSFSPLMNRTAFSPSALSSQQVDQPELMSFLGSSGFLIVTNAFSFFLPAESESHAPFKTELLLHDLFLATGTLSPSVSALPCVCLWWGKSASWGPFITSLLYLAIIQPPACFYIVLAQRNATLLQPRREVMAWVSLPPAAWLEEPMELLGRVAGNKEASRSSRNTRHWVHLCMQFSHTTDAVLFYLYLLFMASSTWSLSSGRPWKMPTYTPLFGGSLASRN